MPGQIALRPPRHDDDDGPTRLETLPWARGIPLVGLVVDVRVDFRQCGFLLRVRIVDDEHVSALPGHRTTDTDSEIVATLAGVPPACGLAVRAEAKVGENLMVLLGVDEVTHLTTEAHRQLSRVGALDDLLVGVLTEEPRGEQVGRELRLSVSGRHVDDEPLELPSGHPLERICHDGMVPPTDERRPDSLNELHEPRLRKLLSFKGF